MPSLAYFSTAKYLFIAGVDLLIEVTGRIIYYSKKNVKCILDIISSL